VTATDRFTFLNNVALKTPCRAATTANITLNGLQVVDGITLVAGDRVLVAQQTDTEENGIYVVTADNWIRAMDLIATSDFVDGTLVLVADGTVNASVLFQLEPL
jgi:phage-related tail fiber protein